MSGIAGELFDVIDRTVEGLGLELVDIERAPRGLLRVTIDGAAGVSLEDCERVSNQLTHLFAVENVEFDRLEVSSPGVDRPLRRVRDWQRFTDQIIHVELFAPLIAPGLPEAGRRKLDGRLLGIAGEPGAERVRIEFDENKVPRTPSQAARARVARRGARGATDQEPVVVEFAVADVERAWLVAELDFRGGQR